MLALAGPLTLLLAGAQAAPPPPAEPRTAPLRPWSAAVFEEARASSRPVLLLLSDPSCARCRLEEDEGLGDAQTVHLLHQFVVTRVDRFDRPDLDDLFTTAVEWLGGGRGYPLAVALLADGRPYAGQAAVPGQDSGDRAGLHRFLVRAWSAYTHERAGAEARAAAAVQALQRAQETPPPGRAAAAAAWRGLRQSFDPRHGGFGEGDSFAPPAVLRLLLASLERAEDGPTRTMLVRTLDGVAASTSTPATLAERALLLEACARAYALTGEALYKSRGIALADGGLARRNPDGTFAAFTEDGAPHAPAIAGWEGLMIGALALSAGAFDRPQDLDAARAAASATLARLGPPARLRRGDAPPRPAVLEDHAFLAEGLLRLDAATKGRERRWLDEAMALADAAVDRWLDGTGSFFDAVAGPEAFVPAALPSRLRNGYDAGRPSANGVMAAVLWRLSRSAAQPRYAEMARRVVDAFAGAMESAPRGLEGLAAALVEMEPAAEAPAAADPALPATETREGMVFSAELAPGQPRSAVPLPLRLRITVPPGRYLVAHQPGAPDLIGLSISISTPDVLTAAPPRYPVSRRLDGKWGSGTVNVYEGTVAIEVPLRALSPEGMPKSVRVRILFQACREQAATCERPESVVLDAPYRPASGPGRAGG